MAISSRIALPLGREGRPIVVDLAPGSTTWIDTHALDPALLPRLPRVENQYKEDYTDYAQRVHNQAHGSTTSNTTNQLQAISLMHVHPASGL